MKIDVDFDSFISNDFVVKKALAVKNIPGKIAVDL
jgi:hypothetical protein